MDEAWAERRIPSSGSRFSYGGPDPVDFVTISRIAGRSTVTECWNLFGSGTDLSFVGYLCAFSHMGARVLRTDTRFIFSWSSCCCSRADCCVGGTCRRVSQCDAFFV